MATRVDSNQARASDWQLTVESRARRVRAELLDLAEVPGTEQERRAAADALDIVDQALTCKERWFRAIAAWWSGWHIERAWRALHEAEVCVIAAHPDLTSRLPGLRQRIASYLHEDDLRRVALDTLQPSQPPSRGDKAVVYDAMRAAFDATDDVHSSARALRNKLIAAALILFTVNTVLGILGFVRPGFMPLCAHLPQLGEASNVLTVCASGGKSPAPPDIWLVQVIGAFGAIIAAVILLVRRRPSLSPYVLVGYQALIKVLLGAALAVVGVLALSAGVAQGLTCITSQSALLLWAAVLGYSQQVGTRLLDNYADRVMDQVRPLPEATIAAR
ncbi:MAG: hypothetical protein JOZ47_03160 [Kutzneria sp.]|nr:hypothetical protein [Kutzneria sp.]